MGRTRDTLWADVGSIYAAILAHPFVTGLTDGSLPRAAFRHYIVQDAHYLRGYAKALAVCAARAPDEGGTVMFAEHAAGAIAAERDLHASLMAELGGSPEEGEPVAPTTRAYVSYLMATVLGGSYAEALGAVLPCYWIYARVGEDCSRRGSPDPLYARWIAMYGGEEFQAVVDAVLRVPTASAPRSPRPNSARCASTSRTTSRYEWMFWDAGCRREGWPV